ncbi:hypothetical protein CAPTEDRAFT_227615 [Capitella teleta]|uniref:L-serine ammonia-lyase n=1 Tax=Capitella teleta TaxID=283909 RepID=R7UT95_CAPTE|nr:hypothetical protein CAPTEDRAFT_227615 [Capitella teleta]|eukprot:ELU06591.1 hypothetical protein CAPTEDRAFT_227615 [Capitella teleta]
MERLNVDCIPLEDIRKAQRVLYESGGVVKTPLVPLNVDIPGKKIFLKLENLQPVHSFKIRGAGNAIHSLNKEDLEDGIFTSSAGNFAQGLAFNAQKLGVECTVLVPDSCSESKLNAIKYYGGIVKKIPWKDWWKVMETHQFEGIGPQRFIHPVCDADVIAGNGSIGLEILEDLPEVDIIVSPYGGGGCVCGVASVMKALKPQTRMFVCEDEGAAPLAASLAAGEVTSVANHRSSFVDGMCGKSVFPAMWRLARSLVEGSYTLSLREICDAVKLLVEKNCIVAEGAGAAPVAAALREDFPPGNIVCIVSGGNIDTEKLVTILQGDIPA